MAVFNGRYRWDGTKKDGLEPISWYPGAYDVKIDELPGASDKIQRLRSHICIYAPAGEGQSVAANPERFARRICLDFALDIGRVLWVEDLLTPEDRYEIVVFTPAGKIGGLLLYRTVKRKAQPQELELIEQTLLFLQA